MSDITATGKLAGALEKQKPKSQAAVMRDLLEGQQDQYKMVLPKHMDPERMVRLVVTEMRKTPKLAECTPQSFLGAVMTAAQLGLEPGVGDSCYLVPYFNKRANAHEAQLIVGYKGMADLVRRSGQCKSFRVRTVFEGDSFDYSYGLDEFMIHKPMDKSPEWTHVYGVFESTNGGKEFMVLTRAGAERIRKEVAKGTYGPWFDNFEAMARKTIVRRMAPMLPQSTEFRQALNADGGIRTDHSSDFDNAIITPEHELAEADRAEVLAAGVVKEAQMIDAAVKPPVNVEPETGEIVDDSDPGPAEPAPPKKTETRECFVCQETFNRSGMGRHVSAAHGDEGWSYTTADDAFTCDIVADVEQAPADAAFPDGEEPFLVDESIPNEQAQRLADMGVLRGKLAVMEADDIAVFAEEYGAELTDGMSITERITAVVNAVFP